MGILKDFINKIINKKEIKLLTEGKEIPRENKQKDRRAWLLNNYAEYGNAFSKQDLEYLEFIKSYCERTSQKSKIREADFLKQAYSCLVSMKGKKPTEQEFIKNGQIENKLLDLINRDGRYSLEWVQGGENPCFYHIRSSNYRKTSSSENLRRIYINCNSANIAKMAYTLLNYNGLPNFYLKFCSNRHNQMKPRGEKIVIYCDKSEVPYMSQLINYAKQRDPDVFKGSDELLPFLPKLNNTANIAKEPKSNIFINLRGERSEVKKTANEVIAKALMESYSESFKEIAMVDKNLRPLLSRPYSNETAIEYMPYVYQNFAGYLVQSMRAKMEMLAKLNDFEIEGMMQKNIDTYNMPNMMKEKNIR